ncbi:winged helix-turn-helix transcriptional regulator [Pseudonocardia sp. TRM90224]|uniref:winged helix-turn-helix transcriptional regulator n=1 Tax=Pseudonocardia sp. TRM90224 TaxID=2812678 RepID=UPI001E2CD750|nr:helix-turn-helix domain-containing protein [Pseudonocardia sp. TRM90224]
MDRKALGSVRCSVARTAAVVGDAWTMLVLRDIFRGRRRFDDLAESLGIARNVLTNRLTTLIDEEIVVRVPYREGGSRERHEYQLTEAGRDLRPVIQAMLAWGDTHRPGPGGPPVRVEHDGCGEPVRVELRCAADHLITRDEPLRSVHTGA